MAGLFEFEVSLRGIKPRIWRRFLLVDDGKFGDLQRAIKDSFGWSGGHLWEFRASPRGRVLAGWLGPDPFDPMDEPPDADDVDLAGYFVNFRQCLYEYDFGDGWLHEVKRNRRVSLEERCCRRLLAGRRACPPEDCGGAAGYHRMASIVETGVDPWGEDVEELRQWLGGWDPAAFDLAERKRSFDG